MEELTTTMTQQLRREALNRLDFETVHACALALEGDRAAMLLVTDIINTARAQDESKPFMKVIMPR